ncbi:MAG: MFS transporter [Clostridia bacterium]|nr:MFS transporter [Clostridia bacterium]
MNVKTQAADLLGKVRRYWRTPPEGRYMTYKEILSLSFGGNGVRVITYYLLSLMVSVGNAFIGNTIGIPPGQIYVIWLISVFSSFPLTALRARMIDTTRSMKGKYRPYLLTMGLPTTVLACLYVWMPYEKMSLFFKCATVLVFNIAFQFFYNFYADAYDSLINVLSPNSIERSDVLSIRSVIENLAPSIMNFAVPLAAKAITGENTLFDLRVFRYIYPPVFVLGFLVSMLVYVNTEEKIVQAKTHVAHMKFLDALRAVARNKYFWVISLAGWLGFLEGAFGNIIQWMYHYQDACTAAQYSVITLISGNASFWPNLIAPFAIRRFGKQKVLIFSNALNIIFIATMLPVTRNTGSPYIIWMLLACLFMNTFMTALGSLLTPSVNADIRDYQHYITGERIDGMFATVGLIGTAISLMTSSILPTLYDKAGLNATVAASLGYTNSYDVLYNQHYFVRICGVLIVASIVGAVLNVIPYFFYDLSETDQKGMIAVLKIRAMFEDRHNGTLTDERKEEAESILAEAKEYCEKELSLPSKARGKEARRQNKTVRAENEKVLIARRVRDEIEKYTTEGGRFRLSVAEKLAAAGPDGYGSVALPDVGSVKAMPKSTEQEKENRRRLLMLLGDVKAAKKAMKKDFPNGIVPFDEAIFDRLFKSEYENEVQISETLKKLRDAKDRRDAQSASLIKTDLRALQKARAQLGKDIKTAQNESAAYYRAAKPFLDALKTIREAEDYEACRF